MANGLLQRMPTGLEGLPYGFGQQSSMPAQVSQAQPSSPSEPQGFRQRARGILGSIGGFLQNNPDLLDTLAIGFGGMSMNPNQALMQQAAGRIQQRQELALRQQQKNRTIEYLRSIGRDDLVQAVEANPEIAASVLSDVVGSGLNRYAPQGYAPQVDIVTGQLYGTTYDPNTQEYKRVDVPGAFGLTPEQEAEQARENELAVFYQNASLEKAEQFYDSIERNRDKLNSLYEMQDALDRGAESGYLRNLAPSLNEATAALRQAATKLGLGVIASVTFGALSAPELNLALTTEIDTNLPPDELRAAIERKTAAIEQRQQDLIILANQLNSGMPYDEFQRQYLQAESERLQVSTPAQQSEFTYQQLVEELARRQQDQ